MNDKLSAEQADRLLRIAFHAAPDSNHPSMNLLRGMQDCSGVEAAIAAAYELGCKDMRKRAAAYLRNPMALVADRKAASEPRPFEAFSRTEAYAYRVAAECMDNDSIWEDES